MRTLSLRSIAASRRSTAAFIPSIAYGECSCEEAGKRKRSAAAASARSRATKRRAKVAASSFLSESDGRAARSLARAATLFSSTVLKFHFMLQEVALSRGVFDAELSALSGLVCLGGVVHHHAAEILGELEQALVAFVPLGARLIDEHGTLKRPAQLDKTGLPHI